MNTIKSEIINVAILNSKILGEDFIEAYIPFVSTLISKKQYDKFSVEQICEDFFEEYTFKIPAMPMTEILTRMLRRNIIDKDIKGEMIPNYEKIIETDFNEEARKNLMKYENIKNKYIEYAMEHYKFEITDSRAEENLSDFIKENCVDAILDDGYIRNIDTIIQDEKMVKDDIYILYKFIIHLYEKEYELFKIINNFCLGYAIAGALSLDNIGTSKKNFKNKKIFFDTKFILRVLGMEGEFYQKSYKAIIEILRDNECKLYMFRHTFDETREILENAKNRIKQNRLLEENVPQVQKYFMENKFSEGDIKLFIATLRKKLEDLEICISNVGYTKETDKYQISPEELYEQIVSVYKKGNIYFDEESKRETIFRDVKSIELIYREMKGNRSAYIETANIFFVTTNKALAYACKNFDKTQGKSERIAPCITDIFLGTILWFQDPIRYDELKENQIIANCYAAIKPNSVMINKYAKEVEKLKDNNQITGEDYVLLKNYEVVDSMLSDRVMGNIENINEGITYEILDEIKFELTKDINKKLEEEMQKTNQIMKEKEAIEQENKQTINVVKREAKNKARIKGIIVTAIIVGIPCTIIGIDLYFNIVEALNLGNVFRVFIYCAISISSIFGAIKNVKNFYKIEEREYRKKCKKYHINVDK